MSRSSRGLSPNFLDPEIQEARLIKKVKTCRENKFYGTVTLHLVAGNLVRFETRHIEKLEPEEEPDGVSSGLPQEDGQQVQEAVSVPQQAGEAS